MEDTYLCKTPLKILSNKISITWLSIWVGLPNDICLNYLRTINKSQTSTISKKEILELKRKFPEKFKCVEVLEG